MRAAKLRRGFLWAAALSGLVFTAYASFTLYQSVPAPDDISLMGGGTVPNTPRLLLAPLTDAANVSTVLDPRGTESLGAPGATLFWRVNESVSGVARALAYVRWNASWVVGNMTVETYDVPALGVSNATYAVLPGVPVRESSSIALFRDVNVSFGAWLGHGAGWIMKHDAAREPLQSFEGGAHALLAPDRVEGSVANVLDGRLLAVLLASAIFATCAPFILLVLSKDFKQVTVEAPTLAPCKECGGAVHAGVAFCYRCGAWAKSQIVAPE